jgi:hypothetical protein
VRCWFAVRAAWALYLAALALYAVAFFLPTFAIEVDGHRTWDCGYAAFAACLFNASGLVGNGPILVWLANPALWAAAVWFARRRWYASTAAGIVAVLLALSCGFGPLILAGYYLWLTSMVLVTTAGLIMSVCRKVS